MNKRLLLVVLVLSLGVALLAAACGSATTTTTAAATTPTSAATDTSAAGTDTTAATAPGSTDTSATGAATGEPIKLGYDEGFTDFMSYDTAQGDMGIKTALAMLNNQWMGRPLQYLYEDSTSKPDVAVDKARKLVESDHINAMIGPIFSPAAKAVTDYLGKSSGIPMISINGQPTDNLATANGLAFLQMGLFDSQGYYFGKYLAEKGYKTANVINYDDTPAHALTEGFKKAFVTEAGGTIISELYIDISTVDFSSYLSAMKPADVTVDWIFGNGAVPFVKQYHDYGLKAPLAVPMSNNYTDPQLAELGDMALGMIACDYYAYTLTNPGNAEFVAAFEKLFPDQGGPNSEVYGAYQAVMVYLEGLKAAGGDTTPAKVIPAIAALKLDTPAGHVEFQSFKNAYIPKRDWFMLEAQKVGDVITWVPVKTYSQVVLGDLSTTP
jgi:branched-chain amino acid transport system substrate-binding protein